MRLQLSVYEKAMPDSLAWEERLQAAAEAGYTGVEISIDETEGRLARLTAPLSTRESFRRTVEKSGIGVRTMCLSGLRKYPLGSLRPGISERGCEILRKAIEFSADVGIRVIQLAGYDVYYEETGNGETRARFSENSRILTEYAAWFGVILAYETMENDFLNTVKKGMAFVDAVRSPYLQMYPDVGNVYNGLGGNGDAVEADLLCGAGHIAAAHLKETVPGVFRNRHFGDGQVDFPRVIRVLRSMGVEMFNAEFWYDPSYLAGDWKKALRESAAYLQKCGEEG